MNKTILLLMLGALVACSDSTPVIEDPAYHLSELGAKTVALVGGEKITRAQLDHALAFYSSNPMVNTEESRMKVLSDLVEEQVMYNQAVKNGFNESPEYLNNQRKLLAYEYRKFINQKAAVNTKITDIDLEIYYEKNIHKYTKPAMSRMAIYQQRNDLPASSKLSVKEVKEAAKYLKVQDGFGEYAKDSHHSNTANREGKLPWVANGNQLAGIPKNVLEAGSKLDLGEVSDPIETESAVFLVRLMDQKQELVTPLAQVKSSLRQQLVIDQKQQALNGFIEKAKSTENIEIIHKNLESVGSINTSSDSMGPPGFPVK